MGPAPTSVREVVPATTHVIPSGDSLPPLTRNVPAGRVRRGVSGKFGALQRPDDEIQEVGGDDVMEVAEDHADADQVHEADDLASPVEASVAPPPSALDQWMAQLVHGYCPPESQLFNRHVPPTTMPGRD